jgi:CheY-like chemotaxis protein
MQTRCCGCPVEDEALIQMLAAEYLERSGFTVHVAGSAAEAMNTLGILPGGVDAVVVDMGLPDRRGDALVREMRALDEPASLDETPSAREGLELVHAFARIKAAEDRQKVIELAKRLSTDAP